MFLKKISRLKPLLQPLLQPLEDDLPLAAAVLLIEAGDAGAAGRDRERIEAPAVRLPRSFCGNRSRSLDGGCQARHPAQPVGEGDPRALQVHRACSIMPWWTPDRSITIASLPRTTGATPALAGKA